MRIYLVMFSLQYITKCMVCVFLEFSDLNDIHRMLFYLCEIQRLAYQLSHGRSKQEILRFHVLTFQFGLLYQEIFSEPVEVSKRRLFGTPFHSVSKHMPQLYRCVSLRSVVAEASERLFGDMRFASYTFNMEPV